MARVPFDPIRLEVFHHLLTAVCEEAGGLLQRSAVSPNIRERRDFSCAVFDGDGCLVGQAAHIPVHLGSAADSVEAVRQRIDLAPGDVAILNDPYAGGTHLPDVTMVRPVFTRSRRAPDWFLVNRAHHADIGGAVPGSMGVARDLLAEGLVIPPVLLRRRGQPQQDVLELLRANVRNAAERVLDLQAQEASLGLASERLEALSRDWGAAELRRYAGHVMDYSERIARATLRDLPAGHYSASDVMEDDGVGGGPFTIRLGLELLDGRAIFDFRDTDPQASGGINANRSVVLAAAVYAVRCLCPSRLPTNDGLFRLIEIHTRRGTLVDPLPPAPVAGGNVETSQRLVDVALQALAEAVPGRFPACSAGTMSNLALGGRDGGAFSFYETLPGGAGAGPRGPGRSALQTHMTNTRNTPVEEQELRCPIRVHSLTVRRRSGGAGAHRGGDGLIKEVEVLVPTTASVLAERHVEGPPGANGGSCGRPGAAWLIRGGRRRRLPAKTTVELEAGDALRLETPGGGGYGR